MNARILIVDDEPRLARSLAMLLEDEGYEATVATNGFDALNQAWAVPHPTLVVLDWNMPRMTGLEVCKRLRQAGYTHPIIFATGMGDRSQQEAGLKAGANAYLIKPFTADEVLNTIQQLLQQGVRYQAA